MEKSLKKRGVARWNDLEVLRGELLARDLELALLFLVFGFLVTEIGMSLLSFVVLTLGLISCPLVWALEGEEGA